MKKIILQDGALRAVVLPGFGGAVSELSIDGTDVLRMDYSSLGVANVLAGGIPVLFPFVSKTRDDEAEFDGQSYTMPMHGFVKDMPFAVVRQDGGSCELCIRSSENTRQYYPYDFEFSLVYRLEGGALHTDIRVKNTGDAAMPFAIGFHPYFLTPDRSQTKFSFGLKEYWDYAHPDADGSPHHGMLEGGIRLADLHDTVFFNGDPTCIIESSEIGYRAKIAGDETFNVVTVCTALENASCVEPWQAKPGAAHDRSACQIVSPGQQAVYGYRIEIEKL